MSLELKCRNFVCAYILEKYVDSRETKIRMTPLLSCGEARTPSCASAEAYLTFWPSAQPQRLDKCSVAHH